jgi:CBS domain-containing protein
MNTVAGLLQAKGNPPVQSIGPDDKVIEAIRRMAESNIGALLVMRDGAVLGILTERDYARKVILMGRSSDHTAVREIMTTEVLYVSPHQSSEQCMALMTENRVRHLPVMDKGLLTGLISMGDLVKDIISDQRFTITQLEHYISGERA